MGGEGRGVIDNMAIVLCSEAFCVVKHSVW